MRLSDLKEFDEAWQILKSKPVSRKDERLVILHDTSWVLEVQNYLSGGEGDLGIELVLSWMHRRL